MSTTFTAALPLIEELKTHLKDLKFVTDEIAKATGVAEENDRVAKQSQATASEVIGATQLVVKAQEGLVEKLIQQQQTSLGEQELLLREHTENLAQHTAEQIDRQLEGVKQSAATVQALIDELLVEQPQLLATIGKQHQQGVDKQQELMRQSIGEQEILLREHTENLSQQTTEQIGGHLNEVKQVAVAAQELISRISHEQSGLLTLIEKQHQQGVDKQYELLRNGVQGWSDKLHDQMQIEVKLLRQATEVLQKNTRQQHDELSAVANQLQVVAGRVTAFAEVMNAAKFATRLEGIEKQQQGTLESIEKGNRANATALIKLDEFQRNQGTEIKAELQQGQREAADTAEQHKQSVSQELARLEATYQQRAGELEASIELITAQLVDTGRQQRLWHFLTIGVVVIVGVVLFLLRG